MPCYHGHHGIVAVDGWHAASGDIRPRSRRSTGICSDGPSRETLWWRSRMQQCDSSVSWDLETTSAVLFNSCSGYPYGHVCCTNSAYWCTKSAAAKLQNTSATLSALSLQRQRDLVYDLQKLGITVYLGSGRSSESEPFRTLDQQPGTDFHMTFVLHHLWTFLNGNWKHTYFQKHFIINILAF